jgi:tripartite-type tricarboxylate transporter receptor subunit TctC
MPFKNPSLVSLILFALASPHTVSQAYPDKPIKVIVIDPPGGPIDRLVRQYAALVSQESKQPVVVENRPGGEGVIGMHACSQAAPDGHTLCALSTSQMSINAVLRKQSIDPLTDLTPLTPLVHVSSVLYGNPRLPFSDIRGLIAYARSHPDKLSYASFGAGSVPHLVFEWLKRRTGARLLHVPYQGAAPALTAVMSGNVDLGFVALASADPQVKAGKIKALATLGTPPGGLQGNVPSLKDQGVDYTLVTWFGLAAPKGVPVPIQQRIVALTETATNSDAFKAEMERNGYQRFVMKPAEFSAHVARERAELAKVVRELDIKAD